MFLHLCESICTGRTRRVKESHGICLKNSIFNLVGGLNPSEKPFILLSVYIYIYIYIHIQIGSFPHVRVDTKNS